MASDEIRSSRERHAEGPNLEFTTQDIHLSDSIQIAIEPQDM
ncbi:MAG: hypothetical protein ABI182_06040 [Candidatus Baltobacteraceae bacterium]